MLRGGRPLCFFFFSSRRRHTRFDCDWSSDVCSSDLIAGRSPTASFLPSLDRSRARTDLCAWASRLASRSARSWCQAEESKEPATEDRKSTRLNSSHSQISYAVFCLKKKIMTDEYLN